MRLAELVMAVAMAIFSLYLMWKSAELPIGWIEGSGPGGGAFPFWLAGGMLICCIWIIIRWAKRQSPPSQSTEPYMNALSIKAFVIGAGSLTVLIGGIPQPYYHISPLPGSRVEGKLGPAGNTCDKVQISVRDIENRRLHRGTPRPDENDE